MAIEMINFSTKRFLVRQTNHPVFGTDFDIRSKRLSDEQADDRFDSAWRNTLESLVSKVDKCDLDFVREHVRGKAAEFIHAAAEHRHFKLGNSIIIAQLPRADQCDQLWIVPSAIRDPWTIYVKFAEVPIRERFEEVARRLGWNRPEGLAEKLLVEFLESVTRERIKRRYADDGRGHGSKEAERPRSQAPIVGCESRAESKGQAAQC